VISQTGKYALRILGYLADRPSECVLGRDIAAATRIPANYLAKILNQLRKVGHVSSQKGWGGGFTLLERAATVPIAEVLTVFDGRREAAACIFELRPCDCTNPCPLHERWAPVRGEYEAMLATVTIGDLRSTRTSAAAEPVGPRSPRKIPSAHATRETKRSGQARKDRTRHPTGQ